MAEDHFLKAQLDARAPAVYCRATPGCDPAKIEALRGSGASAIPAVTAVPLSEFEVDPLSSRLEGRSVNESRAYVEVDLYVIGLAASFEFVNCSDVPARIDIVSIGRGELSDLEQERVIFIPPHESRHLLWVDRVPSWNLDESNIGRPELAFLEFEYWVRDLGANVRDSYRFMLDMRYFERDGSRLIVNSQPAYPWAEAYGGEYCNRVYERLDAPTDGEAC